MPRTDDSEALSRLYGTLGRMVWLWSNSELHKTWPVGLQARFALPAAMTGQVDVVKMKPDAIDRMASTTVSWPAI